MFPHTWFFLPEIFFFFFVNFCGIQILISLPRKVSKESIESEVGALQNPPVYLLTIVMIYIHIYIILNIYLPKQSYIFFLTTAPHSNLNTECPALMEQVWMLLHSLLVFFFPR